MMTFDEKPIDQEIIRRFENSYIVFWTILKKDRTGYINGLKCLLQEGKLMFNAFEDNEEVAIVRILHHIGLEITAIPHGIALKENAKALFYWNVMNKKPAEVKYYSSKINRLGKEEREGPGWAEKILLQNEIEKKAAKKK